MYMEQPLGFVATGGDREGLVLFGSLCNLFETESTCVVVVNFSQAC